MRAAYATCLFISILTSPQGAFADEGAWMVSRLQSLSPEQKIGQLLMTSVSGSDIEEIVRQFSDQGHSGAVILFEENLASIDQTRVLTTALQRAAVASSGIPLFVAIDQEGGPVNRLRRILPMPGTRFSPQAIGKYYAKSPAAIGRALGNYVERLARTLHALGVNMNLAPVLDVAPPGSVVESRSFGNDPRQVTDVARIYVKGMREAGVVPTGKHFPGLGATAVDSHFELPVLRLGKAKLARHDWLPYRALAKDLGAVMVGHVLVPELDAKLPASLSPKIIRLLRRTIGFKGLVISDDLKMQAITKLMSMDAAAVRALNAGCDMLIVSATPEAIQSLRTALVAAFRRGELSEKRIDASVRRILRAKYRYLRSPDLLLAQDAKTGGT